MTAAQSLPASPGNVDHWPADWASDSIMVSHGAFEGLTFKLIATLPANQWTVAFADRAAYLQAMDAIKRKQLAKAGARLAELLNAIWP